MAFLALCALALTIISCGDKKPDTSYLDAPKEVELTEEQRIEQRNNEEIAISSLRGIVAAMQRPDSFTVVVRETSQLGKTITCGKVTAAFYAGAVPTNGETFLQQLNLEVSLPGRLLRFQNSTLQGTMYKPVVTDGTTGNDYRNGIVKTFQETGSKTGNWISNSLQGVPLVIQLEHDNKPATLEFKILHTGEESVFCK